MGDKKFNEFNVAYYISRGQQRSVDEHEDESGGGSGANYQKDATRAVGRHSNSGSYEDIRSSILEYYLREISRRLNILKEREYMDYVHDKWHTVAAGSDLLFLYLYFVSLTALVSYLAFTCLE
ncbi:uncharacterized protein LOC134856951 [Symsagittifera roscoffensis]|uniref:uncharacterized protein LOC134856951 n=1 Tax=Symsagittifera roscoffensis TaxID=84072 RepID=UPI00307B2C77